MNIQQKVSQTLKKIKLNKKARIIVALSGGKDSTVTAYLLKKLDYNIEGLHINLGIGKYSEKCLKAVQKLCDDLKIKLHVHNIKKEMGSSMCYLRSAIQSKQKTGMLKNCAICGVIKKWIMNREARKLKADRIATGHNLDDEAQTYLMNVFKGSPELSANSGPITRNIPDKKFVPRIKPLFYVAEDDIREYSKKKKFPVVYESCPCALGSYRIEVRKFLNTISKKEKRNIIRNFEKVFSKFKKDESKGINYCEICGEPARNKICKMCLLMKTR